MGRKCKKIGSKCEKIGQGIVENKIFRPKQQKIPESIVEGKIFFVQNGKKLDKDSRDTFFLTRVCECFVKHGKKSHSKREKSQEGIVGDKSPLIIDN